MQPEEYVSLPAAEFWVKVVDFLQQNWAVIHTGEDGKVVVYFINDVSRVFDELAFSSREEAEAGLARNGFRLRKGETSLSFLSPPATPFVRGAHPNGVIYSSGRFWK